MNNPYLFTGRNYDAETGLYYYRARMYHPKLGRFLQPDPLGYYDSMNLYQYCLNNPVNWVDPDGEGVLKWLYTGDWNAPDNVYNSAVDAAASFLYTSSPIRGGYLSAGAGKYVGGSLTMGWSMNSGLNAAARYRTRIGNSSFSFGAEGGRSWSQENGYSRTGQFSASHSGVNLKFDDANQFKLGLNFGIFSGGFVIDPTKFTNLFSAWQQMLGLGNNNKCK